MYKVISYFTDLQDFNHPYKVGDEFPRLGLKVSDKRLEELASNKNKQGKPLIEKVEEIKEKNFLDEFAENEKNKKETYTKTDINRMPVAELREMAMRTGVEGADTWSGAELKEYLITILGL